MRVPDVVADAAVAEVGAWRSVPLAAMADPAAVRRDLCFANPAVAKAREMGLPVAEGTAAHFRHWIDDGDRIIVPRHYVPRTGGVMRERRTTPPRIGTAAFRTTAVPRNPLQRECLDWLARPLDGRLMLNAGGGKTVVALMAAARAGISPVLIVVHEQGTLEQWLDRIAEHTDMARTDIGVIQGGRAELRPVMVAMMQTLALGEDRDARRWDALKAHMRGGLVIFDELDVYPAEKMSLALSMFDSVRWGLTATHRHDGLQPILNLHVGARELYRSEYELRPTVVLCRIPVPGYCTRYTSLTNLLTNLETSCRPYLAGLRQLAEQAQAKGRKTALLMQRTEGIEAMARELAAAGHDAGVIHGGTPKGERLEVLRMRRMIVANRRIMGRALDSPALDSVIMTPSSNPALVEQCAGRVLRTHDGKKDPVVVLVTPWHPSGEGVAMNMLRGAGRKSVRTLQSLGFTDVRDVTLSVD